MKIVDSRNSTDGHEGRTSLILSQRNTQRGQTGSLIVQQESLELASEQGYVTLRRYFEHYEPTFGEWVEYSHTVPVRDLVHWLMARGQLRIQTSQDVPHLQAAHPARREVRHP
ncbi:hypothetical protein [Pseudomonas mosselii]|uniref:hypothetical protein n=1 Tax=Pseudomonas mosselii TaxID=78327 RepID=UPI00083CB449|nr:hypothetical protein [Pseudomonas mosselii]MBC7210673.1 hypothetical protein [Pseudomonas sp.]ATB63528.1 hypothetical protein CLJ08_02355 [Pseudomonas mosselii]MDH1101241.1 hypothetical protein [Pseudomonas mosselii]MDH1530031.1 hypothetical protein [Pseudomonas mosselii]MEA3233319.1 hypothetical protein [Pseudomonas mosselii]